MKTSLSLSIITVLTLFAPLASAEEDVSPFRADCLRVLNITEDMAKMGTYPYRLQACIDDKEKVQNQEVERRNRLNIRSQTILERINRNSKLRVYRAVGDPSEAKNAVPLKEFYNANATRNLLQRAQRPVRSIPASQYETRILPQQESSTSATTKSSTYIRPSRRQIQMEAEKNQASREALNTLHTTRLKRALDACKDIENAFHRSNCVRGKMREFGQEEQ